MILTRAILDTLMVSHKCWSRAQYVLLGVPFPTDKGWLKRMEGKFSTDETYRKLIQISQKTKRPSPPPFEPPCGLPDTPSSSHACGHGSSSDT